MAIALGAVLLSIAPTAAGLAYAADDDFAQSPPTTIDVQTPAERQAEADFDEDDDSNTGLWGLLGLLGLLGLAGLMGRKRNTTTDVGYAARPSGSSSTTTTTRTDAGIAARPDKP